MASPPGTGHLTLARGPLRFAKGAGRYAKGVGRWPLSELGSRFKPGTSFWDLGWILWIAGC